jgi:hypothetical protein
VWGCENGFEVAIVQLDFHVGVSAAPYQAQEDVRMTGLCVSAILVHYDLDNTHIRLGLDPGNLEPENHDMAGR